MYMQYAMLMCDLSLLEVPVDAACLRSRLGTGARRMLLSHASFGKPVFLTLLHMMTSCTVPMALAQTRFTTVPAQAVTRGQSLRIAALAVVFAASVVAGNLGLSLVHVSFFQVTRPASKDMAWSIH